MKKRVLYISISILILLTVILAINSTPKEKVYLNKDNIEANKSLAIYIEQENGSYNKTTTFPGKEDGYTLNANKSVCSGNTKISWNDKKWGIELSNIKEETKCFLYFSKYFEPSKTALTKLNINPNYKKLENPDFTKVATGAETVEDNGIYKTADPMYGENAQTYYWRGAATTNHVIFANKCWRIVRINGDGSIRLIYNGAIQSNNNCLGNGKNTSTVTGGTSYNTSKDNSEYVGYTYTEWEQRQNSSNTIKESNLKTQIDNWYNSNIGNNEVYASKIADGKFCNDRNTAFGYTWSSRPGGQMYYAASERIESIKTPTLECNVKDIYTLKAGAITADEVAYAGGVFETTNELYYLYNGQHYSTMSPYHYTSSGMFAYVFSVYSSGSISNYSVNNSVSIRPVINLKSSVNITGEGTSTNPFIVAN